MRKEPFSIPQDNINKFCYQVNSKKLGKIAKNFEDESIKDYGVSKITGKAVNQKFQTRVRGSFNFDFLLSFKIVWLLLFFCTLQNLTHRYKKRNFSEVKNFRKAGKNSRNKVDPCSKSNSKLVNFYYLFSKTNFINRHIQFWKHMTLLFQFIKVKFKFIMANKNMLNYNYNVFIIFYRYFFDAIKGWSRSWMVILHRNNKKKRSKLFQLFRHT